MPVKGLFIYIYSAALGCDVADSSRCFLATRFTSSNSDRRRAISSAGIRSTFWKSNFQSALFFHRRGDWTGVRGAIAGWSKTLAAEVAQYGITVNMVLPGRISTDRLRELDEGKANRTGLSYKQVVSDAFNTIPAKRYGEPDEFAAVVTFLASELASYVTGSMIRVDGGVTMGL